MGRSAYLDLSEFHGISTQWIWENLIPIRTKQL